MLLNDLNDLLVSPILENWSMLVGRTCETKKLTSHRFNNTNRATLSKSGFGNRQTELFTS
jgi:hypothetical protein